MFASKLTGSINTRVSHAASVYLEKLKSFRDLLELYEIGKRSDEGNVAAAARMVGLQVTPSHQTPVK